MNFFALSEVEALARPVRATMVGATEKKSGSRRFVALCGRCFRDADPAYFPRTEHRGRTIYLCTESCLGAFLADPDIFYKVHRNSEKHKNVEAE